jgi:hypothetical protein
VKLFGDLFRSGFTDDPELNQLVKRLSRLSTAEGRILDDAVRALGLGVTHESANNIAAMLATAETVGRGHRRAAAQRAGLEAVKRSKARDFSHVVYAGGVIAETFAMRQYVDAQTWAYLIQPWHDVLTLPAHGTAGVGDSDAMGRDIRASISEGEAQLQQAPRVAAAPSWLTALNDPNRDRILVGAILDAGVEKADAAALLAIIRAQTSGRVTAGAPLPAITTRRLTDLALACRGNPAERWPAIIGQELDAGISESDELDTLMFAPYDVARPHLIVYLYPAPPEQPPNVELDIVFSEVLPGTYAYLRLHSSGGRTRAVIADMLDGWGVSAAQAWSDAADNLVNATIQSEPWPDAESPIRRLFVDGLEAEWLGLLAHRLPMASRAGNLVAMPFRSAALVLRLDAMTDLRAIPAFARLAANAYREAAKFEDQLCPELLWLRADGTPVTICNIFEPPMNAADLPPDFLAAVNLATGRTATQ